MKQRLYFVSNSSTTAYIAIDAEFVMKKLGIHDGDPEYGDKLKLIEGTLAIADENIVAYYDG